MPVQKTITTNSLSNVLSDLIKKVASDTGVSDSLAERLLNPVASDLANIAGISSSNSPYLSEKINEISNYLMHIQDFVKFGVGNILVQGLDVIASDPPSNQIRITSGFCYIEGQRIDHPRDEFIDVDLSESDDYLYVFINQAGVIGVSVDIPDLTLVLARIDRQSSFSTKIQDNSLLNRGNESDAYIASAKDPLFDNNHAFDDDSVAALKNSFQFLFAENIFGTIKIHEGLTVENVQGSLEMNSKQVLIKDPSGNTLSKFNANGTFYYNSQGQEFAHYGRDGARVGNIKITPSTLESVNFSLGSAGFQIKANGNAEFNDITVRGTIYSSQGEIGGWSIGAAKLTGGQTELDSLGIIKVGTANDIAILSSNNPTYRHWIGNANPLLAPFHVKKDGSLYSVKGLIGGFTIDATTLQTTNLIISSGGGGQITAGNVVITGGTSTVDIGTGIDLIGLADGTINVGSGIQISGAGGGTISVGSGVQLDGTAQSITATVGQLGGWTLANNKLYSTNIDIISSSGGSIRVGDILLTGSTSAINVGTAITINGNSAGSINITNAIDIDGATKSITLIDDGQFIAGDAVFDRQGLIINGTYSTLSLGVGNTIIKINNSDGIYLGHANKISAPFSISMQGELKSTFGEIASWTISTDKISAPANALVFDSTNKRIDVGTTIRIDGLNERVESTNYASGVSGWRIDGNGDAEFRNCVVRGQLHTSVFVKDQIHATNGQLLVTDAAVLLNDIDSTQTKIYISEGVFFTGDRLRMKNGITQDEKLKITGTGSDGGGDFITVTRNFDSGGSFSWNKGTAIVSIESRVSLVASGFANLPYIDIIERTGDFTESVRARLGNINGISGATGFGLWSENVFLTGQIVATSGSIANWDIVNNQIQSSNDKIIMDSSTEKITVNTIIIDGANNKIDVGSFIDINGNAGGQIIVGSVNDVYLDGATGKIFAKKGEVGGWVLSSTNLVSDTGATPIIALNKGTAANITITNGTSAQVILGKYDASNFGLKAGDAILNSSGLTISGSQSSISLGTGNSIIKINNSDGLYLGNSVQTSAPFSVTMAGVLKATSGTIGGWTLSSTKLSSSNVELNNSGTVKVGTSNDIAILSSVDPTYRFWVGHATSGSAPFRVNKNGNLIATNADITGTIKATSGYIGSVSNGWSITSNALTNIGTGVIQTSASANTGIKLDASSFRGYDSSNNQRFKLAADGSGFLGSGTTITWNTSGVVTIGGFTVNNSSLTAGSGSTSVGVSATGSFAFYAGNATPGSAPFRVNFNGQLIASNAVITGDISCNTLTASTSGNVAGWDISASALTSNGGTIRTSSSATVNGITLDNTGLRGYGGGVQKFALTANDGRLFANEADIGRKITKITSTSNVGSAINAAISQFGSDGGIIYIPSGTYKLDTTINMADNITIKGSGPDQTRLIPDVSLGTMIDISWNVDNVEILDLEMDADYTVYGGSTASKCINISGSGGIENLRLKNCVFRDALVRNVDFSYAGREQIEGCVFHVASGAVGVYGATNVTACEFNGSGTGAYACGVVSNCEFNNNSIGVNYALQLVDNRFYNCGTCYHQQFYSEGNIIRGNLFKNYSSRGISFTSRNFLFTITDNVFQSGSGIAIELDSVFSGIISNNNFYEHSGSYIINCQNTSTENLSHAPSLNVIGNMVYRCTLTSGCFDINLAHYIESRNSLIISNNNIKSCTFPNGGIGIETYDANAMISNNVITEVIITSTSASFYFIESYEMSNVTGNTLAHITLQSGASNFIAGISFNWIDSIFNGNLIILEASTTSTIRGFYKVGGAERTMYNNNNVYVKNTGSGNGEAFNVSISEGVAVGNNYNGSDSLGTLSISSGVVANNNG